MSGRMVRAAALTLACAITADAQASDAMRIQAGPQVVQYRLRMPLDETVTEVAVPLFAVVPIAPRFTFDIGTAYAQSHVRHAGGESSVGGLTDTQLRANYTLGNDFIILTAGVNLPTGESTVDVAELLAASRIANDFLSFPISSMGTGAAVTGGIAVARPLGSWSLGFGGSVRRTSEFEPIRPDTGAIPRYQPGDEYRLRFGADRPLGAGQLAFGLTYSAFGQDDFGGSLYNTGDRVVGQVGYGRPVGIGTLSLAAWNLYRGAGQLIGGVESPWDDIVNASASLALRATGGMTIEPSLQLRGWFQRVAATGAEPARTDRSMLAELGMRARVGAGPFSVHPGAGYTVGQLAAGDGVKAPLTGFRASLGLQLR